MTKNKQKATNERSRSFLELVKDDDYETLKQYLEKEKHTAHLDKFEKNEHGQDAFLLSVLQNKLQIMQLFLENDRFCTHLRTRYKKNKYSVLDLIICSRKVNLEVYFELLKLTDNPKLLGVKFKSKCTHLHKVCALQFTNIISNNLTKETFLNLQNDCATELLRLNQNIFSLNFRNLTCFDLALKFKNKKLINTFVLHLTNQTTRHEADFKLNDLKFQFRSLFFIIHENSYDLEYVEFLRDVGILNLNEFPRFRSITDFRKLINFKDISTGNCKEALLKEILNKKENYKNREDLISLMIEENDEFIEILTEPINPVPSNLITEENLIKVTQSYIFGYLILAIENGFEPLFNKIYNNLRGRYQDMFDMNKIYAKAAVKSYFTNSYMTKSFMDDVVTFKADFKKIDKIRLLGPYGTSRKFSSVIKSLITPQVLKTIVKNDDFNVLFFLAQYTDTDFNRNYINPFKPSLKRKKKPIKRRTVSKIISIDAKCFLCKEKTAESVKEIEYPKRICEKCQFTELPKERSHMLHEIAHSLGYLKTEKFLIFLSTELGKKLRNKRELGMFHRLYEAKLLDLDYDHRLLKSILYKV